MSNGLVQTPTVYDHKTLISLLKENGSFQQIRGIVKSMLDAEHKGAFDRTHPKPPPAKELYGRLSKGMKVVDVGSGDAKRLIQFEGQVEFATIDSQVFEMRTATSHTTAVFEESTEEVITSFNSMTNNEDVSAFAGSDGIHVIPDVVQLEGDGFSNSKGNRYVTKVGRITYVDYTNSLPYTQLTRYYRGLNTYAPRNVSVVMSKNSYRTSLKMPSRGERVRAPLSDLKNATVKMDGELHKLVVKEGMAKMLDRGGNVTEGKSNGPDMTLFLEKKNDLFFLIEVVRYRGYVPFHDYGLLKFFLERVKLEINGLGVLLTPFWEFGDLDVEGVVVRDRGKDYLLRTHHSFDLRGENAERFFEVLDELALSYEKCVGWEGLCEILVEQTGDKYILKNLGVRNKNTETPISDVRKQMLWPTLYQHCARKDCEINFTIDEVDDGPSSDEEDE